MFLLILVFLLLVPITCKVTRRGIPPYRENSNVRYELIWADEFNYLGSPDPEKWNYEEGFVRNKEPQWYQPENVFVNGRHLVITARKENYSERDNKQSSIGQTDNQAKPSYTSGSLTTAGKFDFQYGKVEIRAKLDVRGSSWPAFWLVGSYNLYHLEQRPFPALAEIDVMEYYERHLYANLFWQGKREFNESVKKYSIDQFPASVNWSQFHVWTLIRTPEKILIIFDRAYLLNEIDIKGIKNYYLKNNPFHENFYFILNLALRKNRKKQITHPTQEQDAKLEVDYIRVYRAL
ncbi:MAG: glycoside hydrolase family 16 protein [Neisseriaceae bacterium]